MKEEVQIGDSAKWYEVQAIDKDRIIAQIGMEVKWVPKRMITAWRRVSR